MKKSQAPAILKGAMESATPLPCGHSAASDENKSRLTPQGAMTLLIVAGTAGRLFLAGLTGLGIDESYMVSVSRQLSLSYFDHPPLSFWLVRLMSWLTGSEAGLSVRFPFILLFAGSTWLCYKVGSELFDQRVGLYGALVLNLAPVFTLCHGSWVLPDGPLIFFMLAAVFCLTKVFFAQEDGPVFGWWLATGAATGLALLSKYSALFLPLGAGLYLLTRRDRRRLLSGVGPWASLLVVVALFSPVILWNMGNHWASFTFQGGRGIPGVALHPLKLLQTVGGQALYLAPWIWAPLVAELFICLSWRPRQDQKRFLALISVGPIATFTIVSLWATGQVLPHWAMPGYLMLFPLLGVRIADRLREGRRYVRLWLINSAIALGIFATVLGSHAATGWGRNIIPALTRKDPTVEMVDWRQLPEALASRGLLRRGKVFIVTGRWLDAAKADFSLGGRLPVVCLSQDPRHFAFLHDPSSFSGWDAVVVTPRMTQEEIQRNYGGCFASIEPLVDVVIRQSAAKALTLKLFFGRDFRAVYRLPYPSVAAHQADD